MRLYCGVDCECFGRNWRTRGGGFYRGAPGASSDANGCGNGGPWRKIEGQMPLTVIEFVSFLRKIKSTMSGAISLNGLVVGRALTFVLMENGNGKGIDGI